MFGNVSKHIIVFGRKCPTTKCVSSNKTFSTTLTIIDCRQHKSDAKPRNVRTEFCDTETIGVNASSVTATSLAMDTTVRFQEPNVRWKSRKTTWKPSIGTTKRCCKYVFMMTLIKYTQGRLSSGEKDGSLSEVDQKEWVCLLLRRMFRWLQLRRRTEMLLQWVWKVVLESGGRPWRGFRRSRRHCCQCRGPELTQDSGIA